MENNENKATLTCPCRHNTPKNQKTENDVLLQEDTSLKINKEAPKLFSVFGDMYWI